VLCRLSYSHRVLGIITTRTECRERAGGKSLRMTAEEIDAEIRD
jgi:hypothetical protein